VVVAELEAIDKTGGGLKQSQQIFVDMLLDREERRLLGLRGEGLRERAKTDKERLRKTLSILRM
jgi:hypothetical protein